MGILVLSHGSGFVKSEIDVGKDSQVSVLSL